MRFFPASLSILTILFSLTACKKKPTTTHSDIYFVGALNKYHKNTTQGPPLRTAVYWKNGILTQLTDSLTNAVANTIAVDNKDIYVGGSVDYIATYWKNGVAKNLGYGIIYAIKIVGHDVYVAGVSKKQRWSKDMATYWKNGVATVIGPGTIYSLTVKNDDVYMAGVGIYNSPLDVQAATYWKNNTRLPLNDTTGGKTYASDLFLYDGDVYIAGLGYNNSGKDLAVYWKNGHIVSLSAPEGSAQCIFIQNDDVYACGAFHDTPVYWKNGVVHTLANTSHSWAMAVAVQDNNLYVVGSNQYLPVYWKNGARIPLSSYYGSVYAMDIVSY